MLLADKLLRKHEMAKTLVRSTLSCNISKWACESCRDATSKGGSSRPSTRNWDD